MTVISNSATYLLAGIAVFLLGAFHLALPSGYSVGAAVLLLMGLYSLRPLAYFKDRSFGLALHGLKTPPSSRLRL